MKYLLLMFCLLFMSCIKDHNDVVKTNTDVIKSLIKSKDVIQNDIYIISFYNDLLSYNFPKDSIIKYNELINQSLKDSIRLEYTVYCDYITSFGDEKDKACVTYDVGNFKLIYKEK